MDVMREQLVGLLDQRLYDSAATLGSFLVSATSACLDVSSTARAENLVLYADALHGKQEYRRALNTYKQAQQLSKVGPPARQSLSARTGSLQNKQAGSIPSIPTTGVPIGQGSSIAGTSDAEVKFKVAQCYVALKETRAALTELEGIPSRLRNLQTTLMLARLYHSSGYERAAVVSYKECLRQNPYVVEAIKALALLGVSSKDIHAQLPQSWDVGLFASSQQQQVKIATDLIHWILHDGSRFAVIAMLQERSCCAEQIINYVKSQGFDEAQHTDIEPRRLADAHSSAASHDYKNALNHLRSLGNRFPGNVYLQVEIARAEAALGRSDDALQSFQNARILDSHLVQAMDEYAFLLLGGRADNLLNRLTNEVLNTDPRQPESWVTTAIFWQAREDPDRALTYVEKAIRADERHALAHLVKGNAALDSRKLDIAAAAFRKVQMLHFDLRASQGLVRAYLAQEKHKEALLAAREAIKTMPQSAVAITLVGHVYAQNANEHDKARKFYESAIRHDPNCLEAVVALADLHLADERYGVAYELLLRYIAKAANDVLHAKLGQVLAAGSRLGEALTHYEAALSINPRNAEARIGLHRVEKLLKGQDPDAGDAEEDADAEDAEADHQDNEFFS